MSIPLPKFVTCDETSMRIKVLEQEQGSSPSNSFPPTGCSLVLQYKEVHQTWKEAKELKIDEKNEVDAGAMDMEDLEPGTPYYVRFLMIKPDGSVEEGPETVYDTKPVDCTPKEKKCTIM